MKHLRTCFFYAVSIILLLSSLIFPIENVVSAENLTIKVGMYENPPKVFTDSQGRVIGIFPDILNDIARRENWTLRYVKGSWEECLARLKAKELDLMVDVAVSEKRALDFDFSDETVFVNWGAIYTRNGLKVESFPDLGNRRIAVMRGSIHTDGPQGIRAVMKQFDIPCTFVEAEDYVSVLALVEGGGADAGVVNRLFGDMYDQLPSGKNIVRSPVIFSPQHLKFAFPKGGSLTPLLKRRISFHLADMKNDPKSVFHKVMTHYFSGASGGLAPAESKPSMLSMPFSPAEKVWIASHPVVKIAIDPEFSPFEFFSESGEYSGMGADYVERISEILGIRFEVVKNISWRQAVSMAEKKDIDALPCVGISEKRKEHFLFSKPYLVFPRVIVTRTASPVRSIEDLKNLSVAVQAKSSHHEYIKEKTRITPVLFDTFKDALLSVSRGESEAAIGNLAVATDTIGRLNLTNLKIAGHTSKDVSSLAFAVRKDWPELVNLIDRALETIPESEKRKISRTWVPGYTSGATLPSLALTRKEQAFLEKHGTIRVGIDPSYPPFEWRDDLGEHQGISADSLKILGQKLGVTFEVIPSLDWPGVLKGARDKTLDLVPCVSETQDRRTYMGFTDTYLTFPIVIITRTDTPFITGLKDLNGLTVSVVKGYAPQESLEKQYPGIRLSLTESPHDSLKQVSVGSADACVENLAVAVYLMKKHNIHNLKVAAPAEGIAKTSFSMGVRKDWPELVTILNKALASIPPNEQNAISGKWLSVRFEHVTDWRRVIRIVGLVTLVSAVILLVFFYWNRRLAREISQRIKVEQQLMEAKAVAEKASKAKSVFLANMSHEIRTPMNAILGYSQIMQNDRTLSSSQKDHVETIIRSGEHLLHIINDILEMSKIEAGKLESRPSLFDLRGLLHDVAMMVRIRAEDKGLELCVEVDDTLPRFVSADEGKLRQILINLLGNAVKFTDKGRVFLKVASRRPLTHEASLPDHGLVLECRIEDTGPGIPAEDQKTIFESFEQSGNLRSSEGTGLGLAICRQYLHFLGGDISVSSTPGEGSVFSFTFPVLEARLDALSDKNSKEPRVLSLAPGQPVFRILVVDDKKTNRDILVRMLERVGFEVREATDGEKAIELFSSWAPHMIMMDIRMPGMDGVTATRKIKESPRGKDTVIIAVSASALEEERVSVLKHGADDFIRKPFRENVILDAVRTHLGVEYLTEDRVLETGDAGLVPDQIEVGNLPRLLGDHIRRAIEGGYHEDLVSLLSDLEKTDEKTGRALLKMALDYDYDSLLSLFNGPGAGEAKS